MYVVQWTAHRLHCTLFSSICVLSALTLNPSYTFRPSNRQTKTNLHQTTKYKEKIDSARRFHSFLLFWMISCDIGRHDITFAQLISNLFITYLFSEWTIASEQFWYDLWADQLNVQMPFKTGKCEWKCIYIALLTTLFSYEPVYNTPSFPFRINL